MLIYDLQCELADLGGPLAAFKSIYTMIEEESLALARNLPPPSSFDRIAWHSVEDDQLAAKQWGKFQKEKDLMKKRFARFNNPPLENGLSFQQARDVIVNEHVSHVVRQVERLERGQGPARRDHMGYALARYLQSQKVNRTELLRLKKAILDRKWEGIPVIWYRSLLAAQREIEYRSALPRKYDVNDEIDLPRMAVALNAASVCITDRSMAALCSRVNRSITSMLKRAHVDDWTPKSVFAIGETSNAADFIEAELVRRASTIV